MYSVVLTVALDSIDSTDSNNDHWRNHCLPWRLMVLVMMCTSSVGRHCFYLKELEAVVHWTVPCENVPYLTSQLIASIISVHFRVVLIPVAQVPVVAPSVIVV